eukprot:TRINITY_DN2120_c1_g1_i1.p1 TRINITY_DN2120_c1_g1~~TRINITY_DN2120_c1_g1_i1.p1  ORF type:complete len:541 (+),score=127.04 TRINITY_DN2120_c1_g1_i1:32-1624(+)
MKSINVLAIFFVFCVILYLITTPLKPSDIEKIEKSVSGEYVHDFVEAILSISNDQTVPRYEKEKYDAYEISRKKVRSLIRNVLLFSGFDEKQIEFQTFEHRQYQSEDHLSMVSSFYGENILIWSNSTVIPDAKIKVFMAHYDTIGWGAQNKTGAYDNLVAATSLIGLAQWIHDVEVDQPYLILLTDQTVVGCLGSKAFVKHHWLGRCGSTCIDFIFNVHKIGRNSEIYIHEDVKNNDRVPSALLRGLTVLSSEKLPIYVEDKGFISSLTRQLPFFHGFQHASALDSASFEKVPVLTISDSVYRGEDKEILDKDDVLSEINFHNVESTVAFFSQIVAAYTSFGWKVPMNIGRSSGPIYHLGEIFGRLFPGIKQYVIISYEIIISGFFAFLVGFYALFLMCKRTFRTVDEFSVKSRNLVPSILLKSTSIHFIFMFWVLCASPIFGMVVISLTFPALFFLDSPNISFTLAIFGVSACSSLLFSILNEVTLTVRMLILFGGIVIHCVMTLLYSSLMFSNRIGLWALNRSKAKTE